MDIHLHLLGSLTYLGVRVVHKHLRPTSIDDRCEELQQYELFHMRLL